MPPKLLADILPQAVSHTHKQKGAFKPQLKKKKSYKFFSFSTKHFSAELKKIISKFQTPLRALKGIIFITLEIANNYININICKKDPFAQIVILQKLSGILQAWLFFQPFVNIYEFFKIKIQFSNRAAPTLFL